MQAAQSEASVRKLIMEAIGDLPAELETADTYIEIYNDLNLEKRQSGLKFHGALVEAAKDLYIAILAAIEDMLEWLDRKVYSKTLRHVNRMLNRHLPLAEKLASLIFKQGNHAKPVKDKISDVKANAKKLQECAELCHHYVTAENSNIAKEMRDLICKVHEDTNIIVALTGLLTANIPCTSCIHTTAHRKLSLTRRKGAGQPRERKQSETSKSRQNSKGY